MQTLAARLFPTQQSGHDPLSRPAYPNLHYAYECLYQENTISEGQRGSLAWQGQLGDPAQAPGAAREMPIPKQNQHRPINQRRFAAHTDTCREAPFPWRKVTFPAQEPPLGTSQTPTPSKSARSQVGAGKITDLFGSLQIPVNLEGGSTWRLAQSENLRLDELKSCGKNLFQGEHGTSSRPNPSQLLWCFGLFKGNCGCLHSQMGI